MPWKCKYCPATCEKRAQLFKHYRLKHGTYARTEPFPCLHQECLCTFKSLNALHSHLSRFHTRSVDQPQTVDSQMKFRCLSCEFLEPCTETEYFAHLRSTHLKVNHKVDCPYKDCKFQSSVYSTFNAHKSKTHREHTWENFKSEIIVSVTNDACDEVAHESQGELEQLATSDTEDLEVMEEACDDLCGLGKQLEHNQASLLLKMQTILHIPESAVQEVIQHLCQIHDLSQPLLYSNVKAVLKKHYPDVDELVVKEIICAVSESNVMTSLCGKHGSLGTVKRRTAYVRNKFPLVMPVEYVVEKGTKTVVYVPIQHMLQKLLNKTDILDKAMSEKVHVPHEYSSYVDGEHFKENCLLSVDEFTVALILYLDDFEVANPLGTSRLKHKMCAVYWVIANVPAKYRSTLNSIQLALLCNTTTIKQCGYEKVLQPLIHDLVSLEQHGVYVEQLGTSVKGTVLFVAADNLAAHSIAGFHESFTVNKFCRVCMASRGDIQQQEMAAQQKLTMRVIFCEGDIRKMTMTPGPNSVDDLINWFKKSVESDYNFTLQYEDPEFNNALCNLTDISDLPNKPTIRIIPVLDLIPVPQSEISSDVSSQPDTDILSTSSLEGRKEWPEVFDIPKFPVDVEYRLRQGNLMYLRDGTFLKVTKDMKHDILEKLAEKIYGYKAYPTKEEFEVAEKALVAEHPCLKEQGSSSGCQGWINSLKFKMGNYRTKMRQLGRPDVTVNGGKRGKNNADGEPSHKNIKKPRKGELNYLPEFPEGMDVARLEAVREAMVNEMQKKNPNDYLIRKNMDITFALRREEVVEHEPDVSQMAQRWPALFTESQVYLEFNRVAGRNLKEEFFGVLDGLCPSLMEIFKRKTGRIGKQLADLIQQTTSTEPTAMRCLVLRGLPVILGDDASMFFKSSLNLNEGAAVDIPVGILCYDDTSTASPASPASPQLNPSRVGIILEGSLVMETLNLPQAMCLLFGFTYALHLQYPKCLKNTFTFIQQVMLNLGRSELPPKVQKLKNDLAV